MEDEGEGEGGGERVFWCGGWGVERVMVGLGGGVGGGSGVQGDSR